MKITRISQVQNDSQRASIFVDEEFVLTVDKSVLIEAGLYVGMEVTSEELSQLQCIDVQKWLQHKLQGYWQIRPRSVMELRKYAEKLLVRKLGEIDSRMLEDILLQLADLGLSEVNFVKWYTEERMRQKKYGQRKVIADLVQKGVPSRLANEVVTTMMANEQAQIKSELLRSRFGAEELREIKDIKQRARAMRWLASRGF